MSLTSLSSTDLSKLIQLVKDKEGLEAKLKQVKSAIDSLASGAKAKAIAPGRRGPRRGRRRSSLKDSILKALDAAGKAGSSVKDLAANLKANPGSVAVWFYTTGKKVKGLRKIGPAKYSYTS
jgi:hypothetical protein